MPEDRLTHPQASGMPEAAGLDDATLVVRAREGDNHAFETLVRRYQHQVFRIAARLTAERHDAADAAQDAFVKAWRRLPDLAGEQAFAAWLYRITISCAHSQARARRPRVPLEQAAEMPDRSPGPAQQAQASALSTALRSALNHLPPAQRACWILRETEGMSYDQIAGILRISPGAVRGRLYRARTQLAEELKPWR